MRPLSPALAAALALFSGCTGREDLRDASRPGSGALVEVGLSFTRDARARPPDGAGDRAGDGFAAQAHFARFRAGETRRAAVLLGLGDEREPPLDRCLLVDGAEELDRALGAPDPLDVELLDAGRLLVKGPTDAAMLLPRHYPELTPDVNGVIYSHARAGDDGASPGLTLEPGASYDVVGEGGGDVGPFTTSIVAPRAFPSLGPPSLVRGGDLDLAWTAAGPAEPPLLVTVSWSWRSGARELRCRVRDTGSYSVPRELLASLPPPPILGRAEVTVSRVRRQAFAAPGVGRGEVTISLREVAPLAVAEER